MRNYSRFNPCHELFPAVPFRIPKASPHNSRLTAQAPLRQLRHGICVAKMLDNVGLRYPHRASGAKAPRTLRPLPLLRFAVSATGGAHLCSIQYYLRFWLGICRTSLAVSALRIMRYCLNLLILRVMLRGKRQLAIDSAGRLLGGTDFICQAHQPRFTAGGWDGG